MLKLTPVLLSVHKEPIPGKGTLLAGSWAVGFVLGLHPERRHCSYPGPDPQEERTPRGREAGQDRSQSAHRPGWSLRRPRPLEECLAIGSLKSGRANGVLAVPGANLPRGCSVLSGLKWRGTWITTQAFFEFHHFLDNKWNRTVGL